MLPTDHLFSYQVQDGIVYLTIAERGYPQKLAFLFLKEVAECFQEELKNSYGTTGGVDYLSKIETIENSYSFLKFGMPSSPTYPTPSRESDSQEAKRFQRLQCEGEHRQIEPGAPGY